MSIIDKLKKYRVVVAAMFFLCGVLAVLLHLLRDFEDAEWRHMYDQRAAEVGHQISREMGTIFGRVETVSRFYSASNVVDQAEFTTMSFLDHNTLIASSSMVAIGYIGNGFRMGESFYSVPGNRVRPITSDKLMDGLYDQVSRRLDGTVIFGGAPLMTLTEKFKKASLLTLIQPIFRNSYDPTLGPDGFSFAVVDLRQFFVLAATVPGAPRLIGINVTHPSLAGEVGSSLSADVGEIRSLRLPGEDLEIHLSFASPARPTLIEVVITNKVLFFAAVISGLLLLVLLAQMTRSRYQAEIATHFANKSNRAKSQFFASMSHELRTPLNGILGMSDLIQRGRLSDQQREQLGTLNRSAEGLLAIINNILDFSKAEAGKFDKNEEEFNFADLITDVLKTIQLKAREQDTQLFIDYPWSLPRTLVSDPLRLRQIITNLLANAVKFTKNGRVTISIRMEKFSDDSKEAQLVISVSDTGIGIADEIIPHLFKPFAQADSSITRNFGGTGLGLSIVAQLCELLGGSVTCKSKQGEGTTFTARVSVVPVQKQHPNRRAVIGFSSLNVISILSEPCQRTILETHVLSMGGYLKSTSSIQDAITAIRTSEEPIDLIIMDPKFSSPDMVSDLRAARPEHPAKILSLLPSQFAYESRDPPPNSGIDSIVIEPLLPEHLALRSWRLFSNSAPNVNCLAAPRAEHAKPSPSIVGKKVLVVEDDRTNQMYAKTLLGEMQCEVVVLDNGKLAVDALLEGAEFDLIFMDCQMPVMDGLTATSRIRKAMDSGQIADTPIVALTANAVTGDRQACLDAGMVDYLSKPVRERDFAAILEKWCTENTKADDDTVGQSFPSIHKAKDETHPGSEKLETILLTDAAVPSSTQGPENVGPEATPPKVVAKTTSLAKAGGRNDPVIDPLALAQTRKTMGDGFPMLVNIFAEDCETYLDDIDTAAKANDLATCVRLAHTLKSSGKMLGCVRFSAGAASLEAYAKGFPDPETLLRKVANLRSLHDATLQELGTIAH